MLDFIGDIVGGLIGYAGAKDVNDDNLAFQRSMVQTRVADAKAAGVHPLAALGMTPYSPNLVNAGGVLGEAVSNAGRSLADSRQRKRAEHAAAVEHIANVNRIRAETDLIEAQAARVRAGTPGRGPDRHMQAIDPNHPLYDPKTGQYVMRGPDGGKMIIPPGMTGAQEVADVAGEAAEALVAANLAEHLSTRGPGLGYTYNAREDRWDWVPLPRARPPVQSDFYLGG